MHVVANHWLLSSIGCYLGVELQNSPTPPLFNPNEENKNKENLDDISSDSLEGKCWLHKAGVGDPLHYLLSIFLDGGTSFVT